MKIKIGCRVDEKRYKQIKDLAKKERWSMSRVAEIAVDYYLKVRGYEI